MAGSMVLAQRTSSEVPDAPDGKVRFYIDESGRIALRDDAGNVTTPEALITALQALVATKQDASTAATDAELTSAVTTINTAIGGEKTAREAADSTLTGAAAAAQATADAALPKAGGTMTGDIVLKGDPTANLHPATKQFVAAQIAALINGAPGALDTLKEIADQLGTDESTVAALTAVVAGKLGAAANLSDLVNAVTARTNLGLGSAATKNAGAAGEAGKVLASDDAALAVLIAAADEVGKGAAPEGYAAGKIKAELNAEETGVDRIWFGRGAGKAPVSIKTDGTPADGSVTVDSLAASLIDGAAGIPSARTLNTGSALDAEATDTQVPSRKAVATALRLLAKAWRSRHTVGTQLTNAAEAASKYFVLNGQTNIKEAAGGGTSFAQPWRIGWVAADEAVEGLTTKLKIKARATVSTAAKVTVHVALYKVVPGATYTLGEEVAGSGKDIELGETKNGGVAVESAEFEVKEDSDFAIGVTVSGVPAANIGVQARLLVHNV